MKTWWTIFFCLLCLLALANSTTVVLISKQSLTMFFDVLIPSLFFMMVILKTMELSGILAWMGRGLQPLLRVVLQSHSSEVPYLLSGLLLGFSANAMLVANAYEEGMLSEQSAKRILYHIHTPTITFCVIACGSLLGNIRYGFLVYGVQVLFCSIGYRLSRLQFTTSLSPMTNRSKKRPMLASLTKAVGATGLGLYQMAGYILLSSVVLAFVSEWIPAGFHFGMKSITEFASSAIQTCHLPISLTSKLILLSIIFGFGGFCGHLQVYTFLNGFPLRYHSYFALRVAQAITTAVIIFLLCI